MKITYMRSELSSQPDIVKKEIDPAFSNDNYGLLGTLHIYWDTGTGSAATDEGMHKLPLGNGSAELVRVKYPAVAGGYTPGDIWELYVGKDNRVEQFVYRTGGRTKPTVMVTRYTEYKKAGPLLISTQHRGTANGKPLDVFFSDVSVQMTGSDTWIKAK